MIDMHSHLLPNIDDGAKDMEIALDMLETAINTGTKGIAVTPHVIDGEWLPSWDKIVAKTETLRRAAKKAGLDIAIYPGGEVAMHLDILELIACPGSYCINGGQYLLVELPAAEIPLFTDQFLFTLQTRGIKPIIAHPERHPQTAKNPDILAGWINKGILVQMNGPSLTGRMGERTMHTAELLLLNDMVHCIGSDAHSNRGRSPNLSSAGEKIISMVGQEKANEILIVNPAKIINGQDVDIPEISSVTKPSKFSFRNFINTYGEKLISKIYCK